MGSQGTRSRSRNQLVSNTCGANHQNSHFADADADADARDHGWLAQGDRPRRAVTGTLLAPAPNAEERRATSWRLLAEPWSAGKGSMSWVKVLCTGCDRSFERRLSTILQGTSRRCQSCAARARSRKVKTGDASRARCVHRLRRARCLRRRTDRALAVRLTTHPLRPHGPKRRSCAPRKELRIDGLRSVEPTCLS